MRPTRPTIKDVARLAGVVPSTVSQALNGKKYVDETTRKRVTEAAKQLGYRPNPHAQQLRMGGVRSIALVSGMPFGVAAGPSRLGFLMEIASVAAEAALSRGIALTLVPPLPSTSSTPPGLDMDGVLLVEPGMDDPQLESLIKASIPVVCIGRSPDHQDIPYVDLHSRVTAEMLFTHLWERGSRCPTLIVGTHRRTSYIETEDVYRRFCAERDLKPVIRYADEDGGEMAGQAAMAGMLASCPEMDGVCALVDAFAVGSVRAAQNRYLRIPEDLILVTRYDGLRARTCTPPLTSMNIHLEEVGALAVELLFTVMNGEENGALYPSPPELIVRESTRKK